MTWRPTAPTAPRLASPSPMNSGAEFLPALNIHFTFATQIIATVDKRKGEWRNEQRVSHQSPDLKFKNLLES